MVVFGLIEGQAYGWWRAIADFTLGPITIPQGGMSVVPFALAIGVILLALLVGLEIMRNAKKRPVLIDVSLFRIRRYGYGNLVALIVSLGEFGILFALSLWIQSVHGFNPLQTGAILAFLAVGTLTAGGAARRVSEWFGSTMVVRIGMTLEIAGVVAIGLTVSVDRSPWWLVIPLIIYGLGIGFATAQLTNVVLQDVPAAQSGQASAMTSTFRQIGTALGAAVLGAILFGSLSSNLSTALADEPGLSTADRERIVLEIRATAGQAITQLDQRPGLGPEATDAKIAFTDAARMTAFAAAVFIGCGLVASFGLPSDRKDPSSTGEEADHP